ncbi:hypothetical protein PR048_010813 [Dryococelus australis]|uniref:Uncharacterized protein n=1 Tax=Dryococelus australis TaxID=614101 RepID=A0ABQ9I3T5_9NEOP|nr:hypothetical protein PR048_010813 [Dryococelus australis]
MAYTHNHFPETWKQAKVVTFPEPGKPPSLPTSYHPISLLSTLSKLLEWMYIFNLITYFVTNSLVSGVGIPQLTRLTIEATKFIEYRYPTVVAFLAIEKVFDRSRRRTIPGPPDHSRSSPGQHPSRSCSIYIKTTVPATYRAVGLVKAALDEVEPWLAKWCIKPNTTKTGAIIFNTEIQDPPTKLQFCGQQIEHSHKVKYLGVIMDRRLIWKHHIHSQLRLRQLFPLINRHTSHGTRNGVIIYNSLIRPILSSVWATAVRCHLSWFSQGTTR